MSQYIHNIPPTRVVVYVLWLTVGLLGLYLDHLDRGSGRSGDTHRYKLHWHVLGDLDN